VKISGTRVGDSESIFNAENDAVGHFFYHFIVLSIE